MTKFQIESKAGVVFGVWEAESEEAAFAAMVEEGGLSGEDCDGNPTAGTAADWIIKAVE